MSATTINGVTFDEIATDVSDILTAIAPFIGTAFPAAGATIAIAIAVIQGVIKAEPIAVALFNQIAAGTPVSPAQLAEYINANNLANAQTDADISAALAKIAAGVK